MTGKDVKCPQCGEGMRDLAPDYPIGLLNQGLFSVATQALFVHCRSGHELTILADSFAPSGDVYVMSKEDGARALDRLAVLRDTL